jgi:hypothetical protein
MEDPPVLLDYDQAALDAAYDQAAYAPNREQLISRRIRDSELVRQRIGEPERVAYGLAEIERLDIYRTRRKLAPVFIFIHGGAWRSGRVPIVWSRCHFGGFRPWFRCTKDAGGGHGCGRRVARLYLRGHAFACRHCCGLAYLSQSENPRHRAITKAQKLRMRLSGSPSLLDPLPDKPARMHRPTYHRLFGQLIAAEERSLALEIDHPASALSRSLGRERRRELISAVLAAELPVDDVGHPRGADPEAGPMMGPDGRTGGDHGRGKARRLLRGR